MGFAFFTHNLKQLKYIGGINEKLVEKYEKRKDIYRILTLFC